MCKARVFAELDLTMDIDIALSEDASDFEKQQHKDEVYRKFEALVNQGFAGERVSISYFEFELKQ